MIGKIKSVKRSTWYRECQSDHCSSDVHPERCTNTSAELYNGDKVDIDEDGIRNYYGRRKITRKLVERLGNDLHNARIEYHETEGGGYCFDGDLSECIHTNHKRQNDGKNSSL